MCLAIPGKITSITGDDPLSRTGKIDFGGILKEASLAYVPEARIGDYVIVHVGFAISRLDEEEANQIFGYLREMQELADLEDGSGGAPAQPVASSTVPASAPSAAPPAGLPAS
jgi:hydrogenase expression/formation protein HypC